MAGNSFGTLFRFTSWGESHGPAIGCVVDGTPPRIPLSEADIQVWMEKRRPGQSRFVTQRHEPDTVRILLTGQSDSDAAVTAVNRGQIFRILSKPCPVEVLQACLRKAVDQHRLSQARTEILGQPTRTVPLPSFTSDTTRVVAGLEQALATQQLVAWTRFQKPQPAPQPLPPRDTPIPQPDQQNQPPDQQAPGNPGQQQTPTTQSFTGKIVKDGGKYVLKVASNTTYQLEQQGDVRQYENQDVKVIGSLDTTSNTIRVVKIELLS